MVLMARTGGEGARVVVEGNEGFEKDEDDESGDSVNEDDEVRRDETTRHTRGTTKKLDETI
jgi:hypothetical protein